MPVSLNNQAYVFLCSLIGGMLIAFVYDTFRIKRKIVNTGKLIIYLEDLLFWIMIAVIIFMVMYYSNDGEVRGYIFIGNILGAFLYMLLFSKAIVAASVFIIGIIVRVIKTIFIIIMYPIRIIMKILSVPGNFFLKILNKVLHKVKLIHNIKVSRAKEWTRIIKNLRKKI